MGPRADQSIRYLPSPGEHITVEQKKILERSLAQEHLWSGHLIKNTRFLHPRTRAARTWLPQSPRVLVSQEAMATIQRGSELPEVSVLGKDRDVSRGGHGMGSGSACQVA